SPPAKGKGARRTPIAASCLGLLEEVKLREAATHNGLGLQAHPPFQQGGVQASGVVVEVEVPFQQLPRLQRRTLPVQSTPHRTADDEGDTARTVVGPGAVVMDAPAKFAD